MRHLMESELRIRSATPNRGEVQSLLRQGKR